MHLEEISILSLNKIDWSLCISILALILSLFTYIIHDRRLKRQELLLNEHQLKKISQEQAENTKASVKANVIKHDRGKRVIKVFNAGKAIARNINIEILSEIEGFHIHGLDEVFPYEFLHPQEGTEFSIILFINSSNTIKIRTTWDDEFASANKYEQILTM